MSANGKKWSQFAEATSLVDGDKLLVRDVSEAAADQIKEMTTANLSNTLGVAGHLSDPTLHMTKADINDRHLNKAPSNAIVGDGVDDYVSLNSSLLQFGDSLSDIPCGESAIIEIDDLGNIFVISAKATGSAPNNERTFIVKTDGKLEVKLFDSATTVYIGQTGSTVLVVGRRYHVVWTYDGSGTSAGIKLYVNGVAETLTLTELGSYTAMHASGASAYLFRFSANYGKGKIYSYVPWNRQLSASDIALLAANGNQPDPADKWAGPSNYTSDFSGGTNSWTGFQGAADGNIDGIGGEDDTLRFTINSATSASHWLQLSGFTVGKWTEVTLEYYIPSSNSNVDGLGFLDTLVDLGEDTSPTLDAWVTKTVRFKPTTGLFRIRALDGGASTVTDSGGNDVFFIKNIVRKPLGALASHQGRNAGASTWTDESANTLDATVTGATQLFNPTPHLLSGNYTPELTFGGGNTGLTTSKDEGYYEYLSRNLIYVEIRIQLTAKGSSTGTANIGLPVTSTSDANRRAVLNVIIQNGTGVDDGIAARAGGGTSTLILSDMQTGVGATISDANFTDTTNLFISGVYRID